MNKKVITVIILVCILPALIQVVSASSGSATRGNSSISTEYSPGQILSGKLNFSFSDISSNAYLETDYGQKVPLTKVLSGNQYTCTTSGCSTTYITKPGSGVSSRQFYLDQGKSILLGFNIPPTPLGATFGGISTTQGGFQMNISSDSKTLPLMNPPLKIDLLNDNNPEWTAYTPNDSYGSVSFGNYGGSSVTNILINSEYSFCEVQHFSTAAANVQIGAVINATPPNPVPDSSNPVKILMTIRELNDSNSNDIGECDMSVYGSNPDSSVVLYGSQFKGISCTAVNKSSTASLDYEIFHPGDYVICIRNAKPSGDNYYGINSSVSQYPKGFYEQTGIYNTTPKYSLDFQIFSALGSFMPLGYYPNGNITFNDSLVYNVGRTSSDYIENEINNYISSTYSNNCSNGCVVPINLTSGQGQTLDVSGIKFYAQIGPTSSKITTIYNLTKGESYINSKGYITINLQDTNFTAPQISNTFGSKNVTFSIVDGSNTYKILTKQLSIIQTPQVGSLSPLLTIPIIPTTFTVNLNSSSLSTNVTKYIWDFGDGSPTETSTTNTINHTYNNVSTGNGFKVKVTVVDSLGYNSTSTFPVKVQSPNEAVNTLLTEKLNDYQEVMKDISNLPNFTQVTIINKLDLDTISSELSTLQSQNKTTPPYDSATHISMMKALLGINIPSSIQETSSASSVPFGENKSQINLDALKRISGGSYDSSQSDYYINYIESWALKNVTMTMDYSEFSANYGSYQEPFLDFLTLNVESNSERSGGYLIIPNLKNINFQKNLTLSGDYYSAPLSSGSLKVQFSTSSHIDITHPPIFVAPSLDSIPPKGIVSTSTSYKVLILILILVGLGAVATMTYIILGKWYQKRYESYLFKNRNDLYNMVTYIQMSKSRGMKNDEIEMNLRRSRWNSEQISYVMKKYAGKGVGLLGFTKKAKRNKYKK